MNTAQPPLVMHIIYALGTGGLENGLVNIINRSPVERYRHVIVCLTQAHEFALRITRADVEVIELHKQDGHDFGMYRRLYRVIRELRPDIIHTRNLAALETQSLGLLFPRIRRVHGEHGRDINDLEGTNRKYQALRKAMRPLVHRYISVSQDLAVWLRETIRLSPDKITQIYNGVDLSRFGPDVVKDATFAPSGFLPVHGAIVLGTVGRLAEVKDQVRLFRMLSLIFVNRPDLRSRLRLIVVGDGPLRTQLLRERELLGLDDVVWMAGDREDIPGLLRLLDIFILPSLAEGISNTILEAMATGLPVVATRVGGNPELVSDGVTGVLVPVGDENRLAEAVIKLIDDAILRQSLGRAGLDRVGKEFDWDRTVLEYLKVYDEVLNLPRSRSLQKPSESGVVAGGR